jgi:hypothetical protein
MVLRSLTSHEEPEDNELAHVCRDGSSNGENNKEDITDVIQRKPTIHLGKWRDD